MKLELSIITPERELLTEQVDQVTLPTEAGEITVLPHHVPLVTTLKPGELIVHLGSTTRHIAIHGGFAEINGERVRVLADAAELSEEIDERRAQEVLDRAEKAKEEATTHQEIAEVTALIERNLARLKVARRKHAR